MIGLETKKRSVIIVQIARGLMNQQMKKALTMTRAELSILHDGIIIGASLGAAFGVLITWFLFAKFVVA